jgi:ABC-type Fe3+/spermidine/putrescine transport system ATPase subunit
VSFLEIDRASKRFGSRSVFEDVSLSVPRGDFLTLLGPSGCGKTTLLRSIAGLQELSSGEIRIGGERVEAGGAKGRAVLVFQDYALFPHMSVKKNVAYGLKLRGESHASVERKVSETLRYLGIVDLADRMPQQLSGGQQQRVALARALVVEPEVLLLDEPLSNLDAKLRVGIRAELKRIQREVGVTTVYVTHDQSEALALSDTVAVMESGRIAQVGTPREVYFEPADEFVADFVGTANVFDAVVEETGDSTGRLAAWGRRWRVGDELPAALSGREVRFCVRPEGLALVEAGTDGAIPGVVESKMFEGGHVRYWVNTGAQTFIVDEPAGASDHALRSEIAIKFMRGALHAIG